MLSGPDRPDAGFLRRRLVAVVSPDSAHQALAVMRAHPQGDQAAVIGRATAQNPGNFQLKTAFGGISFAGR